MGITLQSSTSRLFSDITKHKQLKHICLRCLGHFTTSNILARHQQLCTRGDFMSVLHVLPVPGTERDQIKFNQFKNTTKAPFVIYEDFESILYPLNRKVQLTTMVKQHKVCAAQAIHCSNLQDFNYRTIIKVSQHALTDFPYELIRWEEEIIAVLIRKLKMKCLSMHQQA